MGKVKTQSEESKYIKRINEQLRTVANLASNDPENNPYLSAWGRAIRQSGVAFTKDTGTGRFRIANTAENRALVTVLMRKIKENSPRTAQEVRANIREQIKREKMKDVREKTPKITVTNKEINARLKTQLDVRTLSEKLDFLYKAGYTKIGEALSTLTKGKQQTAQNSAEIYNTIDAINDFYKNYQQGTPELSAQGDVKLDTTLHTTPSDADGEFADFYSIAKNKKR